MKITKLFIVALSMTVLFALNADAGRKRVDQVETDEAVYSIEDIQKELEFGRNMAAQLLADYTLIDNEDLIRYVNLVGNVVLQNASRQEIKYYFGILNSEEINAYATPGGYIFITTAALAQMQSEAELASVLAHEVAHVVERHIVKVLKIRAADESSTRLLGELVSSSSASANALFDQAMGKAFDILFSQGLKVEDEFSADKLGLLLTAMAGYDANSYFDYLQRIEPLIDDGNQQLAKTHPPIPVRIKELRNNYQKQGLLSMDGYKNTERLSKYKSME